MFVTLTSALVCFAPPPSLSDTAAASVRTQLGDTRAIVHADATGAIRYVSGRLGHVDSSAAATLSFAEGLAQKLGTNVEGSLRIAADETDRYGFRHVRLHRSVYGFPVEGDEIRVHSEAKTGLVRVVELQLSRFDLTVVNPPRLTANEAVLLARQGYLGELTQEPRPALVFSAFATGRNLPRLAYRVRIAFAVVPGERPVAKDVYVDAVNGAILREATQIREVAATMTSTDLFGHPVTLHVSSSSQGVLMKNEVALTQGTIWTTDATSGGAVYATPSLSTPFTDATAVSGHDNLHRAMGFFSTTFGWQNWNYNDTPASSGGQIFVRIHEPEAVGNAWFTQAYQNGTVVGVVAYGDADNYLKETARCYDVTAHELGHGVVAATANLAYQFQSGALNEHFADVFGWLADQEDDLIGEDCVKPVLAPAIRDMCSPGDVASPQPGHMRDYMVLENTEDQDYGGVHYNSGIPNHAACLVRNTTDATKVGQIWFQTLRYHLGENSAFADMVQASLDSCSEVLGATASECTALANAWSAVGLGIPLATSCPTNSALRYGNCFCNEGYHVDDTGTGCETEGSITCPANSEPIGGACYCISGYVPNADGTACIPESQATCPTHAHREAGGCVCDECFSGRPDEGVSCSAIPGCIVCTDPLMTGASGSCQCIPGIAPMCGEGSMSYEPTAADPGEDAYICCQAGDPCGWAANGACDCARECNFDTVDCSGFTTAGAVCRGVIPGDCGNETWAGRCVGSVIIYCDNVTDPANPVVDYGDCAQAGTNKTCGLEADGSMYNCVDAVDGCGSVPATGTCVSGNAQYCSAGAIETVDCQGLGCGPVLSSGTTYQYCYPECPTHSSFELENCVCDTGYAPNQAGTACEAIDCPTHAHLVGDTCTCDTGYVVNAAGTGCEQMDCPANAHFQTDGCVCNTGYEPNDAGTACVEQTTECVPHAHLVNDACVCDTGYQLDTAGACIPATTTTDGCQCDKTTACDNHCDCDPECDGGGDSGGCSATPQHHAPLSSLLFAATAGLVFSRRRRRRS